MIGKMHVKHAYEIALIKQKDEHLSHISLLSLARCIAGQAVSMGVQLVGNDEISSSSPPIVSATITPK